MPADDLTDSQIHTERDVCVCSPKMPKVPGHISVLPYTHTHRLLTQTWPLRRKVLDSGQRISTIQRHRPTSDRNLSLQEALQLFRPDFISRSQSRMKRLEQRVLERRALYNKPLPWGAWHVHRGQNCTTPHPLSDHLYKPQERAISGKEMQLRSRRMYNRLPEVANKRQQEQRRVMSQTNRLRAEVFKKVWSECNLTPTHHHT
ncbi:(E2-independent) E3 ubiquitin-conjugating enzyme FATS-like isoform X1 [Alosa sapidissima]|uniref:(E2-independent) E3 ubiquitin-conjugating enzyme FATS-like isoform X1 n=1 Tax=Alosa sapidissima TaxID=34773 RepID=UPI001C09906E|nr:(E2-independent) E3 ubiquitin-conjugating enzyme FATS-like isoform X1 [Alosa sapidissima]